MGNVDDHDQRTPDHFSIRAKLGCWWWCGKERHDWFPAQPGVHLHSFECPHCRQDWAVEYERIMAQPVSGVPELAAAWRDEQPHDGLRVRDLCGGVAAKNFGQTYSLRCPDDHKIDTVVRRFVTVGCPYCRSNDIRKAPRQSIRDVDPELAAIFHPTRNGSLSPETTPDNYRKPLWWKSVQCCGYEWQEEIGHRTLGRRPQAGRGHYYCPKCESVWGSLAWQDPELAAEWHPANELTPWHVKPFSGGHRVKWRCATNSIHEWEASVVDRSSGRLCPLCSMAGTSTIEKALLASAQAVDPDADAAKLGRWWVDVLMPSLMLVVEYDGEYWHRDKHDTDTRKTSEVISMGYRVARIRENDLPHLQLAGSRLRQVSFRPAVGRPEDVLQSLVAWASGKD